MGRRKNTPLLVRLFPHSRFLRIFFVIAMAVTILILGRNMYSLYQIHVQETELIEERENLLEEQELLKKEAENLNNPEVIEKKAREDLGLVKENEVPYIK